MGQIGIAITKLQNKKVHQIPGSGVLDTEAVDDWCHRVRLVVRKRIWNSLLFLSMAVIAAAAPPTALSKPAHATTQIKTARKWILTFSDEFNGTALDRSKWNATAGNVPIREHTVEDYRPENVSEKNGYLRIASTYDPTLKEPYRSGDVTTLNRFAQRFGRFEVRCRLPRAAGTWAAAYLLPASSRWPPEIDIVEYLGRDPGVIFTTNHWGTNLDNHGWNGERESVDGIDWTQWHTYGIEWDPAKIVWFVDNKQVFSSTQNIADVPMYVRLNTAIGGTFAGVPNTEGWPQNFDVDYVRVYRLANMPGPIFGHTADPLPSALSELPAPTQELRFWALLAVLPAVWLAFRKTFQGRRLVTAILASAVAILAADYAWFRIQIIDWDNWYIAVPLAAAELFGLAQILGFQYTLWPRTPIPTLPFWNPHVLPITILIPTVNEGTEIVEQTLRAAMSARDRYIDAFPGTALQIVVCNDGLAAGYNRWQDIDMLAEQLGVRCVTRTESGGAKARNLENARHVAGAVGNALIVIFDADQMANEQFLLHTIPPFSDPRVGWVQTGQYYRNVENAVARWANDQQSLFYNVLCPGKANLNAAYICGTNVVIRASALDQIGGFPQDSVTEDFAASIRLQPRWRGVFLPGVYAEGLGPLDLQSYFGQQKRWASGTLGVLISDWGALSRNRPGGLDLPQRIQYLLAATHYISGLRDFIFILAPLMFAFFGASAIRGVDLTIFLWHFLPFWIVSQAAFWRASGRHTSLRGVALGFASFPVLMSSLFGVISGHHARFLVTPKRSGLSNRRSAVSIHIALVCVGIGALFAMANTDTDQTLAWINGGWIVYGISMLSAAIWLNRCPDRVSAITSDPERAIQE